LDETEAEAGVDSAAANTLPEKSNVNSTCVEQQLENNVAEYYSELENWNKKEQEQELLMKRRYFTTTT